MPKFIVEEKRSQYDPIIFGFEGKEYATKPLVASIFKEIDALTQKALDGDSEALAMQLVTILEGLDLETALRVDVVSSKQFLAEVVRFCANPERYMSEEEKKNMKSSEKKHKK